MNIFLCFGLAHLILLGNLFIFSSWHYLLVLSFLSVIFLSLRLVASAVWVFLSFSDLDSSSCTLFQPCSLTPLFKKCFKSDIRGGCNNKNLWLIENLLCSWQCRKNSERQVLAGNSESLLCGGCLVVKRAVGLQRPWTVDSLYLCSGMLLIVPIFMLKKVLLWTIHFIFSLFMVHRVWPILF